MTKAQRLLNAYKKYEILDVQNLIDEDILKIAFYHIKNINRDNKEILNKICRSVVNRNQPKISYILSSIKEVIPQTKSSVNCKQYWTDRGWNEDESEIKKRISLSERGTPVLQSFWTKKGYTEDEARERVSRHQSNISNHVYANRDEKYKREKSVRCVEYWIKRNYTEEDAKNQVFAKQSKSGKFAKGKIPTHKRNTHIDFYLSISDGDYNKAKQLLSERQATGGPWKEPSIYTKYRRAVDKISNEYVKNGYVLNSEKRGNNFHLDHIFSVAHGFLQKIEPEIIGHYTNLRIISSDENFNKSWRCDKTKEQLLEDYEKSNVGV